MSKKLVLVVIGIIAMVGVGVTLLVKVTNKDRVTTPVKESKEETTIDTSMLSSSLNEFVDPSGFKFKYPSNIVISAADRLGENTYSSLTLSSQDVPGKIKLLIESTTVKSLDDWSLQRSKQAANETMQKVKLADLKAVQFEEKGIVKTIAVDTGTLITISVDFQKNREFWLNLNKTILSSFTFQQPESSSETTFDSTEGDVIFEGEEIVE